MTDSVPVIDIAKIDTPAASRAIDRACREWGFFQVTGHGIDGHLIADLIATAADFFAQPRSVKRRILRSAENPWGFFDEELTKNTPDWKEVFDYGPPDGDRLVPQWPENLPGFEPVIRDYYAACERLAQDLLAAITGNLGMSRDHLLPQFADTHTSFLRLNYYPKCPPTEVPATGQPFGVNQHSDAGALTLLLQDRQPGLEVFREGEWYLVEPRDDALVINVGDMIQVWSNDRYKAALHRVITNAGNDRYSVPYFFNPSYETNYAPLPATVDAANPARYRPINWREFRSLRAAGDYADYGDEIQISHYKL
jgi:isopenicillin N synthase-like dioxygenase